jgi:type II secretory pathway pseudopilin PulG
MRILNRPSGFTLIEMAVGLFLLTLLLGSLLVPLSVQVESRQIAETKRQMDEIKEALIGFAVVNGYLPCPDRTAGTGANDGQEDVTAGTGYCASNLTGGMSSGNLPWSTLGLGTEDVWGDRYKYILSERYARRSPAALVSLTSAATYVRVCDASTTCGTPITANAVAVIVSHGLNRLGAINSLTGTQIDASSAGTDEAANLNTDRDIVQRTQSNVTSGGGVFDDIIVWVPQYVLLNRMVTAGKLP